MRIDSNSARGLKVKLTNHLAQFNPTLKRIDSHNLLKNEALQTSEAGSPCERILQKKPLMDKIEQR